MAELGIAYLLQNDTGVSTLVSTRIYPLVAPENASFPRITYQRISAEHFQDLNGSAGLCRAVIQISVWSYSYSEAKAIAEAVRQAIQGYKGSANGVDIQDVVLTNENDNYEAPVHMDEAGVFHVPCDYAVWFGESIPS